MTRPTMLLTGATGLVGGALLGRARAAGWDAIGIYRQDVARAEALVAAWGDAGNTLRLLACDLCDAQAVEDLLHTLSDEYCPDVLVHLAGRPLDVRPIQRAAWPDFQAQIDSALKSAVLLTQPLLRRMLRRGSGRIIATLSAVVLGMPPRGFATYATAKFALEGYMRCLALECAGRGVSVNTVSPGPMNSAMIKDLPDLLTQQMRDSVPGQQWIDPESVARAIFWLAADAGPEITGCNLPVTSGMVV
jgi:acetoacetyl-CoA reductase